MSVECFHRLFHETILALGLLPLTIHKLFRYFCGSQRWPSRSWCLRVIHSHTTSRPSEPSKQLFQFASGTRYAIADAETTDRYRVWLVVIEQCLELRRGLTQTLTLHQRHADGHKVDSMQVCISLVGSASRVVKKTSRRSDTSKTKVS